MSITSKEADRMFSDDIDAFLDNLKLCSDPGCYQKRQVAQLAAVIYSAGYRDGSREMKNRIIAKLEERSP